MDVFLLAQGSLSYLEGVYRTKRADGLHNRAPCGTWRPTRVDKTTPEGAQEPLLTLIPMTTLATPQQGTRNSWNGPPALHNPQMLTSGPNRQLKMLSAGHF